MADNRVGRTLAIRQGASRMWMGQKLTFDTSDLSFTRVDEGVALFLVNHDPTKWVGRIDYVERDDNGDIYVDGPWSESDDEMTRKTRLDVKNGILRGVSIHMVDGRFRRTREGLVFSGGELFETSFTPIPALVQSKVLNDLEKMDKEKVENFIKNMEYEKDYSFTDIKNSIDSMDSIINKEGESMSNMNEEQVEVTESENKGDHGDDKRERDKKNDSSSNTELLEMVKIIENELSEIRKDMAKNEDETSEEVTEEATEEKSEDKDEEVSQENMDTEKVKNDYDHVPSVNVPKDNYDIGKEVMNRKESGRSKFDIFNAIKIAGLSNMSQLTEDARLENNQMAEWREKYSRSPIGGYHQVQNQIADLLGVDNMSPLNLGGAWIPFSELYGEGVGNSGVYGNDFYVHDFEAAERQWRSNSIDFDKDMQNVANVANAVGVSGNDELVTDTVRRTEAFLMYTVLMQRVTKVLGLIDNLTVPYIGKAGTAYQDDETAITRTDNDFTGFTAKPTSMVAGVDVTGLLRHQSRGEAIRAQRTNLVRSIGRDLEKGLWQGAGFAANYTGDEPWGLIGAVRAALGTDLATYQFTGASKPVFTEVQSTVSRSYNAGIQAGVTPGRTMFGNHAMVNTLSTQARVTGVASSISGGSIDLGDDSTRIFRTGDITPSSGYTRALLYGVPSSVVHMTWGPGVQLFAVPDPNAPMNTRLFAVVWHNNNSNYKSTWSYGEAKDA